MTIRNRRLGRLEVEAARRAPAIDDAVPLSEDERIRLFARALRGDTSRCAMVVYDPAAGAWFNLHSNAEPMAAILNRLHGAFPDAVLFPLLTDELTEALDMLDAGRLRLQQLDGRRVSIIGWPGDHQAWAVGATVASALKVALAQIEPPSAPRCNDLDGLRALLVSLRPLDAGQPEGEPCN